MLAAGCAVYAVDDDVGECGVAGSYARCVYVAAVDSWTGEGHDSVGAGRARDDSSAVRYGGAEDESVECSVCGVYG